MPHLSKRRQQQALIASLILTLSIGIAPMALAKYRPPKRPSAPGGTGANTIRAYRPPKNPSAPRETGTNTTRGDNCDRKAEGKLTPLVPFSHIGQTSSSRPTFVWFVPDRTPHPLQFRLFTRTGKPLYRTELQSQSGIMQVTLPANLAPLTIGQAYQWQVVLVCDPQVPSRNVVATAEIQVVEPDASLQNQLAAAPSPQQRIDLYAEAGLWYDAIAVAFKASETAQNQSAVLDLLDSLATSEVRLEAQPLQEWSDRLRQIEAIERQRQASQTPSPKP
ncbi:MULTISPECIES: DUF928 domain-containing protein [Trichocoleus]|uniref:DUF928 domain-containing protein n=1 Tax=Trichocoleus desertorum GB2-A4 TaxID=2933944 RepID=A0ABV0JJ47_9CYAN|nr:DUF928 domain-containing protein [Trichocoleus sp. FACHB-46]MBD1864474.1 DUF928 domain-containing protein [Trichocoleus sp. FACHB-46]